MRVCVLGATGMLGHKLVMTLSSDFEVVAVARAPFTNVEKFEIFNKDRYISGIDVTDRKLLEKTLDQLKPEAIVNAVGLTTRKLGASSQSDIVIVNSALPHQLTEWAQGNGARLIHFSTDCVFSGKKGSYSEDDPPDATDLYGRSKLLGEVDGPAALTLRSSIIGREIFGRTELVEWLVSKRGQRVKGFAKVMYSGVTTNFMAAQVKRILRENVLDHGLYQMASPAISKHDLLMKINAALDLGVQIDRDESYTSDKTLDSSRLNRAFPGADKPSWDSMVAELAAEHDLYEGWSRR